MDVVKLKEYIVDNRKVEDILHAIGCHHIKYHASNDYYSAGNKDGDNPQAIIVYNNDNLTTINYTRHIIKGDRATDLIDLVCFAEDLTFPKALQFISNICGIDYYYDFDEDIPESLQIMKLLKEMQTGLNSEDTSPLQPKDPHILDYYQPYVNDLFADDGIDYDTQELFGVGYDEYTNRITIPIYSEIGDLVGVKGRLFKKELDPEDQKYIYLEPAPKGKLLYGLNVTYDYIQEKGCVYVVEAEKGVMQAYSHGVTNVVATGGKRITKTQIEMLTRLGVPIIFAYDQDVKKDELVQISSMFIPQVQIYAVIDEDGVLNDKECPFDEYNKWLHLEKNNVYRIR